MHTAIALVFGFLVLPGPSCTNSDNLALLIATIRTNQSAVCDDKAVSLSCPNGTLISIQVAQYGKALSTGSDCVAATNMDDEILEERRCSWTNTMQYALLRTVVEACQKKPHCKVSTKLQPGVVDPCPGERKFVEVAYKCRPSEFVSRTGCEDEVIMLSCDPQFRIAIWNAYIGKAAKDILACSQPEGNKDMRCPSPHAVEKVMQICHGKQYCQILANNKTFGSSCLTTSRSYYKVVYACVPLGVLMEKYENSGEGDDVGDNYDASRRTRIFDEPDTSETWDDQNTQFENPASQPSLDVYKMTVSRSSEDGSTNYILTDRKEKETNIVKESSQYSSNTKFLIYLSIGALVVVVLVAVTLAICCYKNKKRDTNSKNGDMFTTEAPNIFNDAASDIDNDGDLSHISGTFYDPLHPDMIIYRDGQTKTALRAMKPLSTVYPTTGANMYGNVDYGPSYSREPRFVAKEMDPNIKLSPNFGWMY